MAEKIEKYKSYLIRSWGFDADGNPATTDDQRISFIVEEISHAPQRHGFADFEELVAYLRTEFSSEEFFKTE